MALALPRGIRNNNPGNIRISPANRWLGQLAHDAKLEASFCRFDSPENGIRALGKILRTYQRKYSLRTVAQLIGRWAPPSENNTAAYVASVQAKVAAATGKPAGGGIDLEDPVVLTAFVRAIIQHENGQTPYAASVIDEGVRRALA